MCVSMRARFDSCACVRVRARVRVRVFVCRLYTHNFACARMHKDMPMISV